MDKKIFEQFVGRQVEVFLVPDAPRTSGTLISCDDDHIVLGEEVWACSAVLGVRPLKKSNRLSRPKFIQVQEPEIKNNVAPAVESVKNSQNEKSENKEIKKETPAPEAEENIKIEETETSEKNEKSEPEVKVETEEKKIPVLLPENISDREFEGVVASFFPKQGWGFIESPDVKKTGILLNDGERIFVHINQVTDEALRYKLLSLTDKNTKPDINVVFKIGTNQHGAVADDVREKGNIAPKLPDDVLKVDILQTVYDEGEIEYFRRYEEIPHGEIRVKGNKLYS